MGFFRPTRDLLAIALLAGSAAGAAAQDAHGHPHAPGEPEHSHAATAEVEGWLAEMNEVHQQLSNIQQQVFEADPSLQAALDSLDAQVIGAMSSLAPDLDQQVAEIGQLQARIADAQQAGDAEELQRLVGEMQAVQQALLEARQSVLERPDIAERILAFETRVEARMTEVDPEAGALIERLRELEGLLAAAMGLPQ